MLNLIKLVIDRAIERILSLVSVEDVKEIAVERALVSIREDEIVEGVVNHPRMVRAFSDITSRAVAKHIDLSDLAENIDSYSLAEDVAGHIDAESVASHIDLADLAGEIDLSDIAEFLDYNRLASAVESRREISTDVSPALEERINEAISQGVANALDAANRKTEPVVEQSPDLVTRLLDLAVEKLLARADEAAKNGEV